MTQKITLFIFLFLSTVCAAQDLDFPVNQAIWKEVQITISGPVTQHVALCGDTLLNGQNYSQVRNLEVDDTLGITSSTYVGGLRQANGLVYFYADFLSSEILLYDFGLETNEQITLTMPFSNETVIRTVDSTKFEMLAGKMRKVIYFKNSAPNCIFQPEQWIEGIGSSYGLLWRAFDPCLLADAGNQLLCFQQENEYLNLTMIECFLPEQNDCVLVSSSETVIRHIFPLKIFPNPALQTITLHDDGRSLPPGGKAVVYNAMGETVLTKRNRPEGTVSLQVSCLPVGIYYVQLTDAEGRPVARGSFIKG